MNGCANDGDSTTATSPPPDLPTLVNGDSGLPNNINHPSINNNNNINHNNVPHGKSKRKQHQKLPSKVALPTRGSDSALVHRNGSVDTVVDGFNVKTGLETATGSSTSTVVEKCSPVQRTDEETISTKVPAKRTHKERRFHRLFRSVPVNEVLLNRFSCAFVRDFGFLMQGHMYVSHDWICFHSNIFGIEKIIEIPVHSILIISKSKTAKIIPNAVCIRTKDGRQYFFTSFIKRNRTHDLLSRVLSQRCLNVGSVSNDNDLPDLAAVGDLSANPGFAHGRGPLVIDDSSAPLEENVSTSSGESSDDGDEEDEDDSDDVSRRASSNVLSGGNIFVPSSSVSSFVSWFIGLPKLLIVLFACLILLALLLCVAGTMTYRLLYLRTPSNSLFDMISSTNFGEKGFVFWEQDAFDRVNSLIDQSLKLVDDVKRQLDNLKRELSQEEKNHQRKFAQ